MIKIEGRYSPDNMNAERVELTAEEITNYLQNGHRGMLSFQGVFGGYKINGIEYSASALSIGDETFVYERDGKIVVPTYFQKRMIGMEGDPNEKVKVDVIIDPIANPLFVTIVRNQKRGE